MTSTPNLGLGYIAAGQTSPEIPHNSGLNILDALVCGSVKDRDLTAPPAAVDGDRYIVGPSATGAWAAEDGNIAIYLSGQWYFYEPKTGWTVFVEDEKCKVVYEVSSTSWRSVTGESIVSLRDAAGGTSIALAASWTSIPWGTQDRYFGGQGNPFTHSTSSSNHQITLVEAGDYLVDVDIGLNVSVIAAATVLTGRLTLGGSEVTGSKSAFTVPVLAGADVNIHISKLVTATAGQVLTVEAQKSVTGTTVATKASYSRINVRRV